MAASPSKRSFVGSAKGHHLQLSCWAKESSARPLQSRRLVTVALHMQQVCDLDTSFRPWKAGLNLQWWPSPVLMNLVTKALQTTTWVLVWSHFPPIRTCQTRPTCGDSTISSALMVTIHLISSLPRPPGLGSKSLDLAKLSYDWLKG